MSCSVILCHFAVPGELLRTTHVAVLGGQRAYTSSKRGMESDRHKWDILKNKFVLMRWLSTDDELMLQLPLRRVVAKQVSNQVRHFLWVRPKIVCSVRAIRWRWVLWSVYHLGRRTRITKRKRTGDTRGSKCTTPFPVYLRHMTMSCVCHYFGETSRAPFHWLTEEKLLPCESRWSWILIATARKGAVRRIRARAKCSTEVPLWMVSPSLCGFCLFGRSVTLKQKIEQ